tara:strand:- start:867 stop:1640 length:774 start_codon:yes stop_codon:yes gene_type:complete
MKIKILSFLCLIILLASCDKYSREKYPKLISKTASYQEVNSCYSTEFENLNKIPTEIQNKISKYLKNRLRNENYKKLEFENGYVLSDKPIKIEKTDNEKAILALLGQEKEIGKTDCDTILAFPIYSVVYQFKKPEIGIEKAGINLIIDKNGNVIKDIDFPKAEFIDKIIPIDSVHSELIRRKIPYKKLNIHLWFDKRTESFVWSTNTLIREGSIMGPSCFPEVKYHFKMNAKNGKITEYNFEKREEYFAGSENYYIE